MHDASLYVQERSFEGVVLVTVHSGDELMAKIRRTWRGKLRPVRSESLHPALPPQVREFLAVVGLPGENCWKAVFHDLPPREPRHVDARELVTIGTDQGTPIVVDAAEGSVWTMTLGVPQPLRLFNSTVPTFLYAFGRMDATLDDIVDSPPARSRELVEELR